MVKCNTWDKKEIESWLSRFAKQFNLHWEEWLIITSWDLVKQNQQLDHIFWVALQAMPPEWFARWNLLWSSIWSISDDIQPWVKEKVAQWSNDYLWFNNAYIDAVLSKWSKWASVWDIINWSKENFIKLQADPEKAWAISDVKETLIWNATKFILDMKNHWRSNFKWQFKTIWEVVDWVPTDAYDLFFAKPDMVSTMELFKWTKESFTRIDNIIENLDLWMKDWYNMLADASAWRFLRIFAEVDKSMWWDLYKVLEDRTKFNIFFWSDFTKAQHEQLVEAFLRPTQLTQTQERLRKLSMIVWKATKIASYTIWYLNWIVLWVSSTATYAAESELFNKLLKWCDWGQARWIMENLWIFGKTEWIEFQTADVAMDWLKAHDWLPDMFSSIYSAIQKWLKKLWIEASLWDVQRTVRSLSSWLHNLADIAFDTRLKQISISRAIIDRFWSFDNFMFHYNQLDESGKTAYRAYLHRKSSMFYEWLRWFSEMPSANTYSKSFRWYMSSFWFMSSWWVNKWRSLYKQTFGNLFRISSDMLHKWVPRRVKIKRMWEFLSSDENWIAFISLMANSYFWNRKLWRLLYQDYDEEEPKTIAWKISRFIEEMSYLNTWFQWIWSASISRMFLATLDWYEIWWLTVAWTKFIEQLLRDFLRQYKSLWILTQWVWAIANWESVSSAIVNAFVNMWNGMLRYMWENADKYYLMNYVPVNSSMISNIFMTQNPYQKLYYDMSSKSTQMKYNNLIEQWKWWKAVWDLFLSNVPLFKALKSLYKYSETTKWSIDIMNNLYELEDDSWIKMLIQEWLYFDWEKNILEWMDDESKKTMTNFTCDQILANFKVSNIEASLLDQSWNSVQVKINEWIWEIIKNSIWDSWYSILNKAWEENTYTDLKWYREVVSAIASSEFWKKIPEDERWAWASALLVSYMAKMDYDKIKKARKDELWKWQFVSASDDFAIKTFIVNKYANAMIASNRNFTYDVYSNYVANKYPDLKKYISPDSKSWEKETEWKIKWEWWIWDAVFKYLYMADRFRNWDIDAYKVMQSASLPYNISTEDKIALTLYWIEEFEKITDSVDEITSFKTALLLWLRDEIDVVMKNEEFVKNNPDLVWLLSRTIYSNYESINSAAETYANAQMAWALWLWAWWSKLKFPSSQSLYKEFADLVDTNTKNLFPLTKLWNGKAITEWSTTNQRKYFESRATWKWLLWLWNSWVWWAVSDTIIKDKWEWWDIKRVTTTKLRNSWKQAKLAKYVRWGKKAKKSKWSTWIKSRYS